MRNQLLPLIILTVFFACNSETENNKKAEDEVKNGLIKEYYKNGKLKYEYNYKNNKRDGVCVKYDSITGNKLILFEMKEEILNGEYKVFYPNGQLKELSYFENNIASGKGYRYYGNGKIKAIMIIDGGEWVSDIIFDIQGNIVEKRSVNKELLSSKDTLKLNLDYPNWVVEIENAVEWSVENSNPIVRELLK